MLRFIIRNRYDLIASILASLIVGLAAYHLTSPSGRAIAASLLSLCISIFLLFWTRWRNLIGCMLSNSRPIRDVDNLLNSMIEKETTYSFKVACNKWTLGNKIKLTSTNEIFQFTKECFLKCEDKSYFGSDRHIPSEYKKLYRYYLTHQKENISGTNSTRVVMYSEKKLICDYENNPNIVTNFIQYHHDTGTRLLACPFDIALSKSKMNNLDTPDIARFGHSFLVEFYPDNVSQQSIEVVIKKIDERIRTKIHQYLRDIVSDNRTKRVQLGANGRPYMGDRDDESIRFAIQSVHPSNWSHGRFDYLSSLRK